MSAWRGINQFGHSGLHNSVVQRTNIRSEELPNTRLCARLVSVAFLLKHTPWHDFGAKVKVVSEALDAARGNGVHIDGDRIIFSRHLRMGCETTGAREQQMKDTKIQSLRYQVEKWLAPTTPVHVTEFGRTRSGRGRYVCVETWQPAGLHALFFFQHDDGYWHVFPPAADSAQLRALRMGTHLS